MKDSVLQVPEYHAVVLREQPLAHSACVLDTPERAFEFIQGNVKSSPRFTRNVENFCALFLNTRRRCTGWHVTSTGTLDTLLVHPREVFRTAITVGVGALILAHNHPSGDPTPSEADINVTRDLIRAGQLLKIELLDHLVVGDHALPGVRQWASLRELATSTREDCPVHKTPCGDVCANALFYGLRRDPQGRSQDK